MTTRQTYNARVKRGIVYLDQHIPGWCKKIDVADLDLGDPTACVLGQVLDGFFNGLQLLELSDYESQNMGFNVNTNKNLGVEYSLLTECWLTAVKIKREGT